MFWTTKMLFNSYLWPYVFWYG